MPDDSDERVGGGDIRAVYIHAFANHGATWGFAKAGLKRLQLKWKDFFGHPPLDGKDIVLDAARPAEASGNVPDEVGDDDVESEVLDADKGCL